MNLHATQPHESQLDDGSTALASPPPTGGRFSYATGARPLAGYTIKRGIGHGGFGEVYYATSDAGKEVALKLIRRNWDVELRGVTQCLNLKHPNLLSLYDVRQDAQGDNWVVMELMSGESLEDAIARHPDGQPEAEALAWMHGIAAGVAYLHDHGIVHRDLKPGNIFIDEGMIKIGDYGLSKFISCSRRSGQTGSVGTVHYMAPEIANGRYGKEIDIYALGIILYEMLTGHVPFEGESVGEILMKHLTAEPDTSCVAEPYRTIVARCLAKDPGKRFSSVGELISLLPTSYAGATTSAAGRSAVAGQPAAGTGFADPTNFSLASGAFAVPAGPDRSVNGDRTPNRPSVTPPPLPASAQAVNSQTPRPAATNEDPILRWIRESWGDFTAWWERRNFKSWQKLVILCIGLFVAFNVFQVVGASTWALDRPHMQYRGQDFVNFLIIAAIGYFIVRRIQRKQAARRFAANSSYAAPVAAQTPAAAQNPATHAPVMTAPAMPAYSSTETAAAGYLVDYYHRRLNRPYGKIVLIWAAVGAAVAFMFAFFGDAGGDIDRYMRFNLWVPTALVGIVVGAAALFIVQISRLARSRSDAYARGDLPPRLVGHRGIGRALLWLFVAGAVGTAAGMTLGENGDFKRVLRNDEILATVPIGGVCAGLGLILILVLRFFRHLGLGPRSAHEFLMRPSAVPLLLIGWIAAAWYLVACSVGVSQMSGRHAPMVFAMMALVGAIAAGGRAILRAAYGYSILELSRSTYSLAGAPFAAPASTAAVSEPVAANYVATPPPLPLRESPTRRRWKFSSTHLIYQPGPPRERLTQLVGSLLLSAGTCLIVALVVMFLRGETPEPNQYAWLAMSSIIGSWCVLIPAKVWEGSPGDPALRRFVMLAIGLGFGAIAFGLLNWLMISLSAFPASAMDLASPMGGPAREFKTGFFDSLGAPRPIAFLAYFGFLFLIVRWWRLADPARSTRLSIWQTAVAVFCSWVLTIFWPFPQPWGVMVAATIAISVQLASRWLSPTERAALARPSAVMEVRDAPTARRMPQDVVVEAALQSPPWTILGLLALALFGIAAVAVLIFGA
jgi:serine/threonine protein kinase